MILRSIVTAFACFSTIPMPQLPWRDDNMRYMMAAFPLVGGVIGTCLWLWGQLVAALSLGPLLTGVGYALIPVAVSGGIHLDGFADVVDAQASHASPERKRAILKDPHIGAFAVMGTCGYLMAFAALASELAAPQTAAFACIPVISRCLSGLATVTLKGSSSRGMLAAERAAADARVVRVVLALLWLAATILMGIVSPGGAALASVTALVASVAVAHLARTQFGGMSGDLAGFLLQVVELVMLASLVIVGKVA